MNEKKLEERIKDLKEELGDIELEKRMVFEQKGLHVSSKKVIEQIKEYDSEIDELRKKIKNLEGQR